MNKSTFAIICGLVFLFTLFSNTTLAQNSYTSLCNQGLEFEKTGNLDGAISKYTDAIITNPKLWNGYSYRAKANYEKQKYDDALVDISQAINLSPKTISLYEVRAKCYKAKGIYDKAIKDFDLYLLTKPDDIRAIFYQGFSFLKVGDTTKAQTNALRIIDLDPAKEVFFSGEHLLNIYDLEMRRKIVKQSLEDAHAYMEEEKSVASKSLGNIKLTEAFQKLNNAWLYSSGIEKEDQNLDSTIIKDIFFVYSKMKDKPDIPEIARKYMIQATSATGEKKYNKAIALWNKVLDISPYYSLAYFNNALLSELSGDYQNSIVDMKKYLELCPDAPDARGAKDKIYEWEGKVQDQDMVVGDNIVSGVKGSKLGRFTDSRDGKTYKTLNVGFQTIMAENLAYKASSGCWAYENDEKNVAKYGYLYDWETAKNVCPTDWHLPGKEEFETLLQNIGGAGKNAHNALLPGGNSGFSALQTGWLDKDGTFIDGVFYGKVLTYCVFWSSSPQNSRSASIMFISNKIANMSFSGKRYGYSVRCFQDK